ncbi:hypothetical protein KIH27_09675 [Mycobacterium sp. M1]|uniref:Transmembrane protein n=1 Tax=Mycolicibacter acidiphilus TaxID=2835306 RepID=A0ABS5RHS7_9MYCO|nr:hypothetical protein [Mycolicibacter acidiphilus]MBS9533852.1 hypothetical protein [Mycolicibacter acidiphilus]
MKPGTQPDRAHDPEPRGDRLGQDDVEVRAAVRLAVRVVIGTLAFIALAAVWVQNCDGAIETAACGLPYRTVLALGAPLILAGGGLWAFWRTYLVWRDRGTWWGWQGAGWVLLSLMVFAVIVIAPPIVGPALSR